MRNREDEGEVMGVGDGGRGGDVGGRGRGSKQEARELDLFVKQTEAVSYDKLYYYRTFVTRLSLEMSSLEYRASSYQKPFHLRTTLVYVGCLRKN